MPAYVTLPGTSGNYFSTPDVNLLEADDAHFHQSVGNWTAGAGASTLAQDTGGTPTPQFGDGTAKATTDGTGAVIASLTTPTLTAVEHTVGIDIYTSTAGREAFITLDGTDGTVTALTAGTWTRLTATKTVTAGTKTVTVTYRQTDDSDPAASEEVWLDQAVLRTGSDGTFVRSLRIVGDLDMEMRMSLPDVTPASNMDILNTGDAGGNNGYRALILTSGNILFRHGTGAGSRQVNATAANLGLSADTVHTVQCQYDVTAGTYDVLVDGSSVQAGATATGAASPTGQDLLVGAFSASVQNLAGDIYYVIVRDGIDGPVVARFDADDWVGI